jgi:hypothetical protein
MLVHELKEILMTAGALSEVLVFVRRPGALEPDVLQVAEIAHLPGEDALVLHVDLAD